MAARAHCAGCGGDVVAMSVPGKEVVLRLERDVRGSVVPGYEPGTTDTSNDANLEAMLEHGRRIEQASYWNIKPVAGNPWEEDDA